MPALVQLQPPAMMRLVRLYTLLIAVGFLWWPVSLGVPAGSMRLLWIGCAVCCLYVSTYMMRRAVARGEVLTVDPSPPPWWLLALIVAPALIAGVTMPLAVFGDEEAILLPTLTLVHMGARVVGWGVLMLSAIAALGAGAWFVRRFPLRYLWVVIPLSAFVAVIVAQLVTRTETEFVRYPPFVHLVQAITTIFTAGHPAWFRLPVILWWIVGGAALWHISPQWSHTARLLAFVTLGLTPLGLTYHVLLYQSSGEITCAALAALLIGQIVERGDRTGRAGLLGALFGLWIMQRPTALAPAAACALLLLLLGYRKAAWDIAFIAFPVGILWILIYLIGSFQYDFLQPGSGRVWSVGSFIDPLRETLQMLPAQLSIIGIVCMIGGTVWCVGKEPRKHGTLLAAWYIALVNTGVHQVLTTDKWYGYGRFSALMILPLSYVMASLWGGGRVKQTVTVLGILLLFVVTPWNIGRFMQGLRTVPASSVERTVTGGMMPTILPATVDELLMRGIQPAIVLAPSYAFLDLSIARGLLTPAERTTIREQSAQWSPADPSRPVIIHAPEDPVHFRGNMADAREQQLRDAAAWIQDQPGVQVKRYGKDVVYVLE